MLLEDLNELLANSVHFKNQKVAYDAENLHAIEEFYLRVLAGDEKVPISEARMNRIIIAFYGEALRERVGGVWELCEDKNDTAFGLPVLANWAEGVIAFSPVEVRDAQILDRKPVMRDRLEYFANKEEFEANFFKEFE
ncbi:MAG: hypothetical protein V3T84_01360 [Phycisphaerales bacterium]